MKNSEGGELWLLLATKVCKSANRSEDETLIYSQKWGDTADDLYESLERNE